MNTNSNLFQEISEDMINKIFANKLKESVIWKTGLLDGGMFNTTYYVEYGSEHKRAVLRVGPVNRHLLVGYEENLMNAETYVYSICQQIGIPCSKVLCCDTSRKIIDRDFMIVEFIPSIAMSKANLPEKKRQELYFKMGEYLSKLHQVTGNNFGFVSRVCARKEFDTWSEALIYEIKDISNCLVNLKGMQAEEAEVLISRFYQNREILDEIKVPHLLHTDLWEGNVLLDVETMEIVAIIDCDRAIFGDTDFEFSSPWMQVPSLREGYGIKLKENFSENRSKRQKLYQMFYCLLDSYVGYGEYNDRELYENNMRKLRHFLKSK